MYVMYNGFEIIYYLNNNFVFKELEKRKEWKLSKVKRHKSMKHNVYYSYASCFSCEDNTFMFWKIIFDNRLLSNKTLSMLISADDIRFDDNVIQSKN